MKQKMLLLCLGALVLGLSTSAHSKMKNKDIIITTKDSLPLNTAEVKRFRILYVNPLRFNFSVGSTDAPINAPTPPASISLGLTTTGIFPASSTPAAQGAKPQAVVGNAQPVNSPAPTISDLVDAIQNAVNALSVNITRTNQYTIALANNLVLEQQCYQQQLNLYGGWLITSSDASTLRTFFSSNENLYDSSANPTSCRIATNYVWPSGDYDSYESLLQNQQISLQMLVTHQTTGASGDETYATWYADATNKARYDALNTFITGAIVAVQKNEAIPPTLTAAQNSIAFWRSRISKFNSQMRGANGIDKEGSPFALSGTADCSFSWYGKGDIKTTSINLSDVSITSTTPTQVQVLINSCYPPGTVSAGIGISFVHDYVYGFQPSPDPANATNTIQEIQATTDAAATPLYALQYNVAIHDWANGVGANVGVGGAVGSSSGTTNLELLFGLPISFHRRAFFITPALQVARRDQLLPGYKVGFQQNSTLTSIPIETNWKPGFALTFTFGSGQ